MIPKSLSLVLKSAVVLFPLIAGVFLTIYGGARLYEANTIQVDRWSTPYGLLVFSSTPLERVHMTFQLRLMNPEVLQGSTQCTLFVDYTLSMMDSKLFTEEDTVIGIQFPFKVNKLQFSEFQKEWGGQTTELIAKATNLTIVEKDLDLNSLFYVQFTRQDYEKQNIHFALFFSWEKVVHRDDFSTFTLAFPLTLYVNSVITNPYTQNPNAHFVYYADDLDLFFEVSISSDFDVKQSYPNMDTMRADVSSDTRSVFLDMNLQKIENPKANELFSITFESRSQTEKRNQLNFDSGLYIGLGVSLIFGGIHEALRILSELRTHEPKP